ncbi:MAG: hypothetical protein GEU96_16165 [Propionibacteriales bacterium]|nr:hypothetical protein [Propionibacteriales bacterium]
MQLHHRTAAFCRTRGCHRRYPRPRRHCVVQRRRATRFARVREEPGSTRDGSEPRRAVRASRRGAEASRAPPCRR